MQVKRQMESEVFPSEVEGGPSRYFRQLSANEQEALLMARLKKYCQKVYKRVLDKVRPVYSPLLTSIATSPIAPRPQRCAQRQGECGFGMTITGAPYGPLLGVMYPLLSSSCPSAEHNKDTHRVSSPRSACVRYTHSTCDDADFNPDMQWARSAGSSL